MSKEFEFPTDNLSLMRWIGWAQMRAAEEWNRERELSQPQGFVLDYLAQNPGSLQRDIAKANRTTPASVSSLLQGLETRGLIERRPDPKSERNKLVYATPAGLEIIAGFHAFMTELVETFMTPLSEEERATLNVLLSKITAELAPPVR